MTFDPKSIPVRFSNLRHMAHSPAHYLHAITHAMGPSPIMELGTAVHTLTLEAGAPVVCYPGPVRRGKEWEVFKESNRDAQIVTRDTYETAHRMAEAVTKHPEAARLLRKGIKEQPIDWHYLAGRACRSTPDLVDPGWALLDLKTSVTVDPRRFGFHAIKMRYHAQMAFYREACAAKGYGRPPAFIIAVESAEPHPVTVYKVTDRALEAGERMVRGWFETLLSCEDANVWPGYCDAILDLDVPEDEPDLIFAEDAA